MMLFYIECQHGNHKHVFASGVHEAAEHFVTWQIANEAPMGNFILQRVTLQSLAGLPREQLRDALNARIAGIGIYDEAAGWHIRPVQDNRTASN